MIIETPKVVYNDDILNETTSVAIMKSYPISDNKENRANVTTLRFLDIAEPLTYAIAIKECANSKDPLYVVSLSFKTIKVTITTPYYKVARLYADNVKERVDTTTDSLKQQLPEVFL